MRKEYNIELENIIKNYFEKYIFEKYKINGFKVIMPSSDINWIEKCKILCSTIDSILKQFTLLVKYKTIDLELLDYTSPISYGNIPSLLNKKYYYGNTHYSNKLFFYLFSDQCMLSHVERIVNQEKNYRNFYELIENERIQISDYNEMYLKNIYFLENHNFIEINKDGVILTKPFAVIYNDIYLYGVINNVNCSDLWKKEIDKMEKSQYLCNENKLLSRSEIDTFNYFLNNKSFKDSLAIRNKYIHGDMDRFDESDGIHENNYYLLFVILISLVLKIDDEIEHYYK